MIVKADYKGLGSFSLYSEDGEITTFFFREITSMRIKMKNTYHTGEAFIFAGEKAHVIEFMGRPQLVSTLRNIIVDLCEDKERLQTCDTSQLKELKSYGVNL